MQTGVQSDLGLSVLSPLSLTHGIEIVGKSAGLPVLPTADIAVYGRSTVNNPMIARLTNFLIESVALWDAEYHDSPAGKAASKVS